MPSSMMTKKIERLIYSEKFLAFIETKMSFDEFAEITHWVEANVWPPDWSKEDKARWVREREQKSQAYRNLMDLIDQYNEEKTMPISKMY
jgi:hypothetical protein